MPLLSQEAFEAMLDNIQEQKISASINGKKFSLADFLTARGYSTEIENINFAVENKTVSHITLSKVDRSMATSTSVPRRTDLLTNLVASLLM